MRDKVNTDFTNQPNRIVLSDYYSCNSSNSCSKKEVSANVNEPIPLILRILRAKRRNISEYSQVHSCHSSNSCSPKEISANVHEPNPMILRILRAKEEKSVSIHKFIRTIRVL